MGGGVAKMPAGRLWLLLGMVLAFGVAASPAQASRNTHYDFVVSSSIHLTSFQPICISTSLISEMQAVA
jgi:laccase